MALFTDNFLRPPITMTLNALNLCSSIRVVDQVLHPHTCKTDKNIVFPELICILLRKDKKGKIFLNKL
jgi:hypothetical protein